MKTFTEQELKEKYPKYKIDLCFMVAGSYEAIDAETFKTDDLDDAKAEASQDSYHIYIFTKKFTKDYLDVSYLLDNLVDNVEQEGVDSGWLWDMISVSDRQEFYSWVSKWFNNIVGNSYIADELIGELELKNETFKN